MAEVKKDALTGTDTTGHEWDGIQELNTPLPKWWLYVFYATIIWAIGYCAVYPSFPIPGGNLEGIFGYSSRAEHRAEMAEVKQGREALLAKFQGKEIGELAKDQDFLAIAQAGGSYIFADNCAPCHGAGGQGAEGGYPVLADDSWIWGGTPEEIKQTVTYGIRIHPEARVSDMPAFKDVLEPAQIGALADYILAMGAGSAAEGEGATLYAENCAGCHGEDGKGLAFAGAPNLTDAIWLYGGSKDAIVAQINKPQQGEMPAFVNRLSEADINQVSVYVHSLGGGQ